MTDKELLIRELPRVIEDANVEELVNLLAEHGCPPSYKEKCSYADLCLHTEDAEECWLDWLEKEREKYEK